MEIFGGVEVGVLGGEDVGDGRLADLVRELRVEPRYELFLGWLLARRSGLFIEVVSQGFSFAIGDTAAAFFGR